MHFLDKECCYIIENLASIMKYLILLCLKIMSSLQYLAAHTCMTLGIRPFCYQPLVRTQHYFQNLSFTGETVCYIPQTYKYVSLPET